MNIYVNETKQFSLAGKNELDNKAMEQIREFKYLGN
jgi:hypothetical protein